MVSPSPYGLEFADELPVSRADKYEIVEKIAQGGYGAVYRIFIKDDRDAGFFALKSNRLEDFKGKMTNIDYNEMKALKVLEKEENIVKMIELVRGPDEFGIVLELCRGDLKKIIHEKRIDLPLCDIKNILKQYFTGLAAVHRSNIMHRDLKPSNILIAMDGTIKIADFGNSVVMSRSSYIVDVCTIWYKSPELLLGNTKYDEKVDIWSSGCLAAEFWLRKPALFKARTDLDQMEKISQMCGFCSESIWPQAGSFPKYEEFHSKLAKYKHSNLQKYLSKLTHNIFATVFLEKLLKFVPEERMNADDALNDEFFSSAPEPSKDLNHLLEHRLFNSL